MHRADEAAQSESRDWLLNVRAPEGQRWSCMSGGCIKEKARVRKLGLTWDGRDDGQSNQDQLFTKIR